VTIAIPYCLHDEEGNLDEEVLIIMATVVARRENKDITQAEVGERIGNKTHELLLPIVKELFYFYSTSTREEIEERYLEAQARKPDSSGQEAGEPAVPLE
ncbi:hypothetical protein LCGC14_2533480, partial [marine sediment metagenome]